MAKKADLIIDLQFGSTGKGLIAGYLAKRNKYDVVVTANMPNAGHTFIDEHNNKMVHKVLPNGLVSPNCQFVMIGPGAIFDLERLLKEYHNACQMGYDGYTIVIHRAAVILQNEHREAEAENVKIGSTMQGSGAAMIAKIKRNPDDNPTAGHVLSEMNLPEGIIIANNSVYNGIIKDAKSILLEGAQGFSLGINERFYPYCTSRDCSPARFMSDMAIPIPFLRKVIGTARVHPIRVGSPEGGYSGPCYDDQHELTWDEIGVKPERTTVTQRVRRVFSFSRTQLEDALYAMAPDEIFLNFCNYATQAELAAIMREFGPLIRYRGWGPAVYDVDDRDMVAMGEPVAQFTEDRVK